MVSDAHTLRSSGDNSSWGHTKSGRLLQSIRRDMDLKETLFRNRRRNEEVLALAYRDGTTVGGGYGGAPEWERVRENALNIPYRYVRWHESQATSKKLVVKVNRDAGPGQKPGGPGDDQTGMWVGITLTKAAEIAGFRREMKAVINEVMPRGTSVVKIGYHEQAITLNQGKEVGKSPQSVIADVLGADDYAAKGGQEHTELSKGLGEIAQDQDFFMAAGPEGVEKVLARKGSHDDAAYEAEVDRSPKESTRLIRRKVWMQKRRVSEDVGWAPWVYDVEDTPWWWERFVWTVAEVKASPLFTEEFKAKVEGFDGRNVSEVFRGGDTPSSESMGSDARQAMTEDVLDDDERMVEWFRVWFRRPDMQGGGYVKIVAPEMPDSFHEVDESNPHVDDEGYPLIPGFYPFYDYTPILSSLTIPERTTGIPPIAVGMGHFEKLIEYNRIRQEAALKGATRISQIHPGLKDAKGVLDALKNGEIGYAYIAPQGMVDGTGKMMDGVRTYQFTGQDPEIEKQAAVEEFSCLKALGFPQAVWQGVGTADTATQDTQGINAGKNEADNIIDYMELRTADVMAGLRGLIRGNYDDEDFQRLLGEKGAAVMKAWQAGSYDDGDEITATYGTRASAQEVVDRKQLMEAISLIRMEIEPLSGLPIYDRFLLIEELFRSLDVGAPQLDESPMKQLQQMVLMMAQEIQKLTGVNPLTGEGQENKPKEGKKPTSGEKKQSRGGPNPSEGDGPSSENVGAGASRGTK